MGNLFGRKKESRVTEQDKAVLVSLSLLTHFAVTHTTEDLAVFGCIRCSLLLHLLLCVCVCVGNIGEP